ncbi:MAG: prolyl oligopeptidase family serine peptidase [Candidatus Thermoplasmatota archaeon]
MGEEYPLEELASLPEFYHPIASPNGEKVAFYYDKSGRNELYVMDLKTGEIEQLSDGEVPKNARWFIMWGSDSEKIYFHKDEAGNEQNDIYSMDLNGNLETVVTADGQCILQDVSDDGRYLLFTSDMGEQMNLYRYDLKKETTEKLTKYEQPVMSALFSSNGDMIAYAANESDDLENQDVYICRSDGSEKRRLKISEDGYETSISDWSHDDSSLLISDNSTDMVRTGIYDVDSEDIEWFGSNEYEERPVSFLPERDDFLAFRIKEGGWIPLKYDSDGSVEELELNEGVVSFPQGGNGGLFISDNEIILPYTKPDERKELYKYDLDTEEFKVLLEAEYGDIDPDSFVDADYVTYESVDGLEIGALLYDSSERPSPAVVMVHGGPHFQSTRGFNLYAQFLASRGYTVFQPNYRGSIGRGREFKRMIHMDWGGKEQDDVAEGARWLKEQDWIDEDRISVFGGSYGGYSAYMQMVKYPELWTTGIAWIGITDLHKLYEEDMPHFQSMLEENMGDPEENYELWRDRSAIEHVENMERPILMIHGVNDPRCPIEQARIFSDALEDMGWEEGEDFELEELGEEGHGSTDISQKIRAFKILEDYLERRL